jgi:hypothetical protein
LEVEGLAGLLLRTDTFEPLVIQWKCQVIWKVKRKYKLNLITFFDTHRERKNLLEVFLSGSSFCSLGEPILAAETQHAGLIQKYVFWVFQTCLARLSDFTCFLFQTSSSSPFLLHVPDCQTHFLFVLFLIQREKAE